MTLAPAGRKSVRNKKRLGPREPNLLSFGGAERDRTVGLLNAIQALSQLSYSPTELKSNMEKREMSK